MDLDEKTISCEEIPKIKTCVGSLLPKGRLWCTTRNKILIRAYCEICLEYKDKNSEVYKK